MRHLKLSARQIAAKAGWTDVFIVPWNDPLLVTQTTNNTDQQVVLDQLAFGDYVGYDVLGEIRTGFTGGSVDALVINLGVTGALTQFISSGALITAGAVSVAAKTGYSEVAAGTPYCVPSGGKNLILNFDITDAGHSLSQLTAGEFWVWMRIDRWGERPQVGDL